MLEAQRAKISRLEAELSTAEALADRRSAELEVCVVCAVGAFAGECQWGVGAWGRGFAALGARWGSGGPVWLSAPQAKRSSWACAQGCAPQRWPPLLGGTGEGEALMALRRQKGPRPRVHVMTS